MSRRSKSRAVLLEARTTGLKCFRPVSPSVKGSPGHHTRLLCSGGSRTDRPPRWIRRAERAGCHIVWDGATFGAVGATFGAVGAWRRSDKGPGLLFGGKLLEPGGRKPIHLGPALGPGQEDAGLAAPPHGVEHAERAAVPAAAAHDGPSGSVRHGQQPGHRSAAGTRG